MKNVSILVYHVMQAHKTSLQISRSARPVLVLQHRRGRSSSSAFFSIAHAGLGCLPSVNTSRLQQHYMLLCGPRSIHDLNHGPRLWQEPCSVRMLNLKERGSSTQWQSSRRIRLQSTPRPATSTNRDDRKRRLLGGRCSWLALIACSLADLLDPAPGGGEGIATPSDGSWLQLPMTGALLVPWRGLERSGEWSRSKRSGLDRGFSYRHSLFTGADWRGVGSAEERGAGCRGLGTGEEA
jgi:hypothetical protein